MTLKHILSLAALALPLAVAAQNNNTSAAAEALTFDFEGAANWKALGVFDTWEASPFRTGKLEGNVKVVDNPTLAELNPLTGKPVNASTKVLAVQRSRFGSNTFGARIVLNAPIPLTPTPRYIHAWVRSPKAGRVLIGGLGKRKDRADQKDDVVQLAHITTSPLEVNQWREIVVPAAANKGVELHSLLIVPDCESPHELTADFAAYIDNVSITNNTNPTLISGYYPIRFDKTQPATSNDHHIDGVDFTISNKNISYKFPVPAMVYREIGVKHPITAQAGQRIKPNLRYTGNAMHSYYYIDYNQDGQFTKEELVSYSFYKNKNSRGVAKHAGTALQAPEFKLHADLKPGVYRMRLKVDKNNIDAMGSEDLLKHGGGFVDFTLNIHNGYTTVNDHNLNGAVTTVDGKELTSLQVPYGEDFTIKMNPAPGFEHNGFVLTHGVNIKGDSLVKDNSQWERVIVPRSVFNEDGTFTIPGKWMNGNVLIEGRFVQEGNYHPEPIPAWYPRFKVTKLEGKVFAPRTQWYSLQLGTEGFVIAPQDGSNKNVPSTEISLTEKTVNAENHRHLWCFVGDNEEGYQLYNRYYGTGYVLAAPTEMKGSTGAESFVHLVSVNQVPNGYTTTWRFIDSKNLSAKDADVVYMYEDMYISNKVNNRNSKLAFWNQGADHGSTFVIRPVMRTESAVTAIELPTSSEAASQLYDLSGRPAEQHNHGVFVMNGKKVVK